MLSHLGSCCEEQPQAQNLSSRDSVTCSDPKCKISSESPDYLDWEDEYDQIIGIYLQTKVADHSIVISPQAEVANDFIVVSADDNEPPNHLQRLKFSGAESHVNDGYAAIRAANNDKNVVIPTQLPQPDDQAVLINNHTVANVFAYAELYLHGFQNVRRSLSYASVSRTNMVQHRTSNLQTIQDTLFGIYNRLEIPLPPLLTHNVIGLSVDSTLHEILVYYMTEKITDSATEPLVSWLYEHFIRSMVHAPATVHRMPIGRGVYNLQTSLLTGLVSLDIPQIAQLSISDMNVYKYLLALQIIHEDSDHVLAYNMLPGNSNGYLMYTTTYMRHLGIYDFDQPLESINATIDYANTKRILCTNPAVVKHKHYTAGSVSHGCPQAPARSRLMYMLQYNQFYQISLDCEGSSCGVCVACNPEVLIDISRFVMAQRYPLVSDDIMESALVSLAYSGHIIQEDGAYDYLIKSICSMINERRRPSTRIPALIYEALRRLSVTTNDLCLRVCAHAKTVMKSAGDFATLSVMQIREFFERFCLIFPSRQFLGQSIDSLRIMVNGWVSASIDQIIDTIRTLFIRVDVNRDVTQRTFHLGESPSIMDDDELDAIVDESRSRCGNPLTLFKHVWTRLSSSVTWRGIKMAAGELAATVYDLIVAAWEMAKSVLQAIERRLGKCLTRLFIYGFYIYCVHMCSQYSMPVAVVLGIVGSVVAYNDIRDLCLSTISTILPIGGDDFCPQMDLMSAATNIFKSILGLSIPAVLAAESLNLLRSFISLVQAGKSVGVVMDALVKFITVPYYYVMAIYEYRSSDIYKDIRSIVDTMEKTSINNIQSVAQAASFLNQIETLRAVRFRYARTDRQDYVLRIIDDAVHRSTSVAEHCRAMLQGAEESTPSLAISLFGAAGVGKSTSANATASALYDGFILCPMKLRQKDRFIPDSVLSPAAVTPLRLAAYMDNIRPGIVSVIDDCMNTTVIADITAKYDSLVNMISPAQTPLSVADLNQKNKTFYVSEATILTSNTPLNAVQTNMAERNAPLRRILVNANMTVGPDRELLYTLVRFYGIDHNEGQEVITLSEAHFYYYLRWLAMNHENIFNPALKSRCTKVSNQRSREVVVNSELDAFCAQIFLDSTGHCYPVHYAGNQYMLPENIPDTNYRPPQMQYSSLLDYAGRFSVDNTGLLVDNPRSHPIAKLVSSISSSVLYAAAATMAAGCLYWTYKQLVTGTPEPKGIAVSEAKEIFEPDTTTELFEQKGRMARGHGSDEPGFVEENPYADKLRRRYEAQGQHEESTFSGKLADRVCGTLTTAAQVAVIAASSMAAMKGVDRLMDRALAPQDLPLVMAQNVVDPVEQMSFESRVRAHLVRVVMTGGTVSTGKAFALDQHTLVCPLHYFDHWSSNHGITINGVFMDKSQLRVKNGLPTNTDPNPHYTVVITTQAIVGITNICADMVVNIDQIPPDLRSVSRINAINLASEDGHLPYGFIERDCIDVRGVTVSMPGDSGMCGSMYFAAIGTQLRLIGFHTHGTQRGAKKPVSIMTVLTLEQLLATADKLKGRVPKLSKMLVVDGDEIPASHRRNDIVPTPMYGVMAPSDRHPIDLRAPAVSEASLNTVGNALGSVPTPVLREAIAHTRSMLGCVTGHTLTVSEALNGNPASGIKSIDLTTSAGLGFTGTKGDYITGEPGRYRMLPDFEKAFFAFLHEPTEPRVGMAMKAELRSTEKIAANKARMFCYPDLFYTIYGRMLTAHLFANIAKQPVRNEISVGINPHSTDWAELANVFEDQMVIDGDMSAFDNTIPLNVMDAAFDIVKSLCPYMQSSDLTRLKSATFYPTIEYNGLIMKKIGGNTSGGVATAGINSICLLLLLKSAVVSLINEKSLEASLSEFNFRAYGDDSLIGIPKHLASEITPSEIGRILSTYGCQYTSADKSALRDKVDTTIMDVTYLKRRFVRNGDRFNWSAPLPLSVITDIPNYYAKSPKSLEEERDVMSSMYDSVCIELAHHPEDVFYQHTRLLKNAIQDRYNMNLMPADYKAIRSSMRYIGLMVQSLVLEDQQGPVVADDITEETYATAETALRYKEPTQPILERSFKIGAFQISYNSPESLAVIDLANVIRANPYLMGVFNRYGTTRFKMEFTCTASINSTLSAIMRCTYLPGVVPTAGYNKTFANVYSEESYLFNIADRQLVFNIEPKTNLDSSWYIQSTSFSLGSMLFSLENGLAGSTVGSEKIQVSIYARLYDVEVSMPVAQMDRETAVKSETRLASELITGAAGLIESLPIPAASVVAKTTRVIGAAAKWLGFQSPNDGSQATKVITVAFDGFSNSRGLFPGQTFSCSSTKTIKNDPKIAMTAERPLISDIIQQPGLIASGAFTSTTTKVFSLQMCPHAQRYDLTSLYAPTKLNYISRFAGAYYGDVNCQILFNCSPMVSCEVLLVHTIGDPGVADYIANPDASISERFFVQGPTEVSVRIPYVGNRSRSPSSECANGFLTAYLITAPVASTTAISTQVNYTVYTAAADNMILSEPTDFFGVFPQSIRPKPIRSGNYIKNFLDSEFIYLREAYTYDPELLEGEMLESYQDIFLRPEAPKVLILTGGLYTLTTGNPFSRLFLRHRNGFRVTAWVEGGETGIKTVELVVQGKTRGRVLWNCSLTPILSLNISRPLTTIFDVVAHNYPVDPWQVALPVQLRVVPELTKPLSAVVTYSDDTSLGGLVYPSSLLP